MSPWLVKLLQDWPQYLILFWCCVRLINHLVKDAHTESVGERLFLVLASFVVFLSFMFVFWAGNFWAPIGYPYS